MAEQKDSGSDQARQDQAKQDQARQPTATAGQATAGQATAGGQAAGQAKKQATSGAESATAAAPGGEQRGAAEAGAPRGAARRKRQYLIGVRQVPGLGAMPADAIVQALKLMEDVEVVRRLRPRGLQALGAGGTPGSQEIIVVRMDEQRGEALRQSAPPHIVVELDAQLSYSEMMPPAPLGWHADELVVPLPAGRSFDLRFRITGEDDRALSSASVYVYRSGFPPAQAFTDASGQATVTLFDVGASLESIRAVYVKPAADHWDRFIQNPALETAEANTIRLIPLGKTVAKSPGERPVGWGQRMMKLDQIGTGLNGAGVKIGLIDSGCDNTHPALRQVTRGLDVTQEGATDGWTTDDIGHGTHCAGIIAGSGTSEGVAGFAPGAELHVFKLMPGGRFSNLIEALDQCIERQLDVVSLSFSSDQFSELAAQKIAEARQRGVACIVPAGNTGGLVQFPGILPSVFTVSAVGKLGEFPPDTHHAQTVLPQMVGSASIFAANFSCRGPQVAVCAPGVAIISSVPGGGYAAWDGSSIAAAHVSGFAALLLAHHPLLQGAAVQRGEQRVSALFELIRGSAVPYVQADPSRVGAGLPDLQQVPGMLPAAAMQQGAPTAAQQAAASALLGRLLGAPGAEGWASSGERQMGPMGYQAGAMSPNTLALMQLRAAGLI